MHKFDGNLPSGDKKSTSELKRMLRSDKGKKRAAYKSSLPTLFRTYLNRANKKGISFSLTVEQFYEITRNSCTYCGSSNKIGVDRIDSSIGYEIGNVQPCCPTCNLMKYTHDSEAFLSHIKRIYKNIFG